MVGEDIKYLNPILLLMNYWELKPAQMTARLDDLVNHGFHQIVSFVPWQVAESDISHSLQRFLQAAAERRIHVFLILTPELGIHYPYSGVPKHIVQKKGNRAKSSQSKEVVINLAPHVFSLPSLLSPELTQRYNSFLGRMDGFFKDLENNQTWILKNTTLILTGSFWKYYRSASNSSQLAFGGMTGDFSSHAASMYRQSLESFYTRPEFMDPNPVAANRWKTRAMDEINRKWFYQQAEDIFKNRSLRMISKKTTSIQVQEVDLFSPAADPGMAYSHFLQMLCGGHPDVPRLSSLIEENSARSVSHFGNEAPRFVHWSSLGGFKLLTESEKQFLILKSLLLNGGKLGGFLLDGEDWLSLSSLFRNRVETLAQSFIDKEFKHCTRVFYLTSHLWSYPGAFWDQLFSKMNTSVKLTASLDLLMCEPTAQLLFVDPIFIITQDLLKKMIAWARGGRVVAIPRSTLYTESAREILEQLAKSQQTIDVNLGIPYQLFNIGDGKFICYDLPKKDSFKEDFNSVYEKFINTILSLAEVNEYCYMNDSCLKIIPFECKDNSLAIFVMNSSRKKISSELIFSKNVSIQDLGSSFSNKRSSPSQEVHVSNKFNLEVPPYGILPLRVEGLDLGLFKDKILAAQDSVSLGESVFSTAQVELPGFDSNSSSHNSNKGLDNLWS